MYQVIIWLIIIVAIVGGVIAAKDGKSTPERMSGTKRAGRVSLWAVAPPLGLWRSWKHGQRKRDDRLARKIRGEE